MATAGITIEGLEGLKEALEAFEGNVQQAGLMALEDILGKIERDTKNNLTSMLTGEFSDNVLMNSISHTAVIGKDGNPSGDVGIYNMSRKTGSDKRRVTAPLVAFFHQGGTQPHSTAPGSRAARRPTKGSPFGAPAKGQDVGRMHPGFKASPFLDNAWTQNFSKIEEVMIRNLKKPGI